MRLRKNELPNRAAHQYSSSYLADVVAGVSTLHGNDSSPSLKLAMRSKDRLCVFDPSTNTILDLLRADESEEQALVRLDQSGFDLVVLPLREAWHRHKLAAKRTVQSGRFKDQC